MIRKKYPDVIFVEDLKFSYVFVTFDSLKDVQRAKRKFRKCRLCCIPPFLNLKTSKYIRTSGNADNPSNIIWENLEVSKC